MTRRLLALGASLAVLLTLPAPSAGAAGQRPGTTRRYTFENEAGARDYLLHVPSGYRGRRVPLLVFLHGCTQDAEVARVQTHLDELADSRTFLLAYPEQDLDENGGRCWNWFLPENWERGTGEPAIIAGLTRDLMRRYRVDPRRVFVAGVSAGGAMTAVMGLTYPDLYAALASHAGCQYRGGPCMGIPAAVPPDRTGPWAHEAMGSRARQLPLFATVGSADAVAPPANTDALVHQFLYAADLADDGVENGSVSHQPARSRRVTPAGRRPYDVDVYTDRRGCLLEEHWVIDGMNHAYSGGDGSVMYSDPTGPDVNLPMWRFLMSHPMPTRLRGVLCR